jgi:endonuclease/exonuclease/phosphatase (EEP) superfamily protein YafD
MAIVFPALALLYAMITLVSLVARRRWPIELLQHFRPHMIVAGGVGALLCLWLEPSWGWAAIALGFALVNLAALPSPRFIRPDASLAGQPGLTIVWANVWTSEAPLKRTLDWAKAQGADVILIGEYPREASPDDALAGDYPYRIAGPPQPEGEICSTRVVALSRVAIGDAVVHAGPGPHARSFVTFSVAVGDAVLNVIAVHPVPPNTAALTGERDKQIAMLAAHARGAFVIAGDFNATPWTPAFADIPGRRIGAYLFAPTWLSGLPLLGLPIDHLMESESLRVSRYEVGPALGSDHRALLARIHAPSQKQA